MATTRAEVIYPESDGKPMAETTTHRNVMIDLIIGLNEWFADDPLAYVSGNEFVYFVEGNPKRNVSPDVWVARGIDKTIRREIYKTWEEGGKGPDLVIEVSSKSTRREDQKKKYELYRDDLKVREYFLFDPFGEYLRPRLQGHRLVGDEYVPIEAVAGRLPSEVLDLHLEADGHDLRLFDPATGRRLPTRLEALKEATERDHRREVETRRKDEAIRRQAESLRMVEADSLRKDEALRQSEIENDRLRRELEALRAGRSPE